MILDFAARWMPSRQMGNNGEFQPRWRDLPDRALVERAQKGEGEAFDELVRRNQDRIYNAVLRFSGNAEDACDITQGAFINAFRKISGFKGDSAFSTWVYRIAFNQSVSFRREQGRHIAVSLDASEEELVSEPAIEPFSGRGIESEETRHKIQQALLGLSEDDRRMIVLKDIEGRSYEEIASILEIPKGTVRSRLHRARTALRERLKGIVGTLR